MSISGVPSVLEGRRRRRSRSGASAAGPRYMKLSEALLAAVGERREARQVLRGSRATFGTSVVDMPDPVGGAEHEVVLVRHRAGRCRRRPRSRCRAGRGRTATARRRGRRRRGVGITHTKFASAVLPGIRLRQAVGRRELKRGAGRAAGRLRKQGTVDVCRSMRRASLEVCGGREVDGSSSIVNGRRRGPGTRAGRRGRVAELARRRRRGSQSIRPVRSCVAGDGEVPGEVEVLALDARPRRAS